MTAVMPRRSLIVLLAASAVSVAGTRVTAIAIPWLVLVTTGSAAKTGLVAAAELAPLVVAMVLAGPVIDRAGARRISVLADVASAVLVAVIPLLHAVGGLHFGALLVVVALVGAARGPGDTAKATLAPDIAAATGLSVERVAGLTGTVDRTASIIGPGLAGLLIAAFGAANALAVDAVSFAVCSVAVACCVPRRDVGPAEPRVEPYRTQLRAGLRSLVGDRLLLSLVLMLCVTNMLDTALNTVLLPTWIRAHGHGPEQLGLIGSAFGLSATAGSVVAAATAERLPRRTVYLVGFLVCGAPRWIVLAGGSPLWAVVAISLVGGFGAGFLNPILGAVFVERVPRPMLGRVNSIAEAGSSAGMPIGGLVAGAAVVALGLAPVLAVGAAVYAATTLLPTRLSQWRDLDARPKARRQPELQTVSG